MSIFIATGSNLGNRQNNLQDAKNLLNVYLEFIAESRVYESSAIDFENQPDFYNQVLEYRIPHMQPDACMKLLLEIEQKLGRIRDIPKGPRIIDIDLLFWDDLVIHSDLLQLPHPRLFSRSFVILPLSELPGFASLQEKFSFTFSFPNSATPLIIK
jgi:2-amino-4-hydroxy-6-hydroxymethyldihydropteridine diphosphokinase